jgi:hypothetical protein
MRFHQRRRVLSEEEKVFNAQRRAQKDAAAMTCQCCGRKIFAETGTIAHHGYQRPGSGWQTASCMGAKYLPFEVDRERLGDLIEALKNRRASLLQLHSAVEKEQRPVTVTKVNYHAKRERFTDRPVVELTFTRDTFDAVVDANTGPGMVFNSYEALVMKQRGFSEVLEREIARIDGMIKVNREHIAECVKRFEGWKQTHIRIDNRWEEIYSTRLHEANPERTL